MIQLVYIASIGRSGSTLLESMLGAHSQLATMGEVHVWPHELRQGGVRPCGCGDDVPACSFWTAVKREVDPLAQIGPGLGFFREAHNHGHTLRLKRLPALGPAPTSSLRDRTQIRTYGENNAAIVEAFIKVTEAATGDRPSWIVDASKDPYRLAWLVRSGLFRIKVIHLVKDPRAFIYSVTKSHIRGENRRSRSSAYVRLFDTARQGLAWTVQNALFARIGRHVCPAEDYLLIQYERLASDPYSTFELVCSHIGIPYEADAVNFFRAGSVHTIAGNPMRYERRGIELDQEWKTNLPESSRRVAAAMTRWTEKRYGYGRNPSLCQKAENPTAVILE